MNHVKMAQKDQLIRCEKSLWTCLFSMKKVRWEKESGNNLFQFDIDFGIIRFGWCSAQTIISLKTLLPLFKCKCIHTNNNSSPLRIHFFNFQALGNLVCGRTSSNQNLFITTGILIWLKSQDKNRGLGRDAIEGTIGMISKVLFITFDFETCHFVKVYPLSIAVPS